MKVRWQLTGVGSLLSCGSGFKTQVLRLGGKKLYPLSPLVDPRIAFKLRFYFKLCQIVFPQQDAIFVFHLINLKILTFSSQGMDKKGKSDPTYFPLKQLELLHTCMWAVPACPEPITSLQGLHKERRSSAEGRRDFLTFSAPAPNREASGSLFFKSYLEPVNLKNTMPGNWFIY